MISTRRMTGTGFMKCIPITRSGRPVRAAMSVIEIELVLDARIVVGGVARSRSPNSRNLSVASSDAASITRVAAPAEGKW